jgi:hypothetical protein
VSCIERAGWFSGLFSAVKHWYQSVSISGPSATSKPIERKIASTRSHVRITGWSAAFRARPRPGKRDVDRFRVQALLQLGVQQRVAAGVQGVLDLRLGAVDQRALRFSFPREASLPRPFISSVICPVLPR